MKFTTKNLVIMAFLVAISVVLVYLLHIPIIPSVPYLEYDPADIPVLIGAFAFGPVAGIIITIIASAIQALTVSAAGGLFGFLMHVIATSTLVIVASTIYRVRHTRVGAVIGLISGTLSMGIIMMIANHFLTPIFYGIPVEVVDASLLTGILPFNLIKAGGNSIITFIVYKAVSRYLVHGEKFGSKDKSVKRKT